jgi:hypothetical protein
MRYSPKKGGDVGLGEADEHEGENAARKDVTLARFVKQGS